MKARSVLVGSVIALSIGLTIFQMNHRGRTDATLTAGAEQRIPAGGKLVSATDPANASICQSFYRSVCQKRGETRDPTGVVKPDVDGEIQALRSYEKIIHQHPDWSSEQMDEELVHEIYTPKRIKRITSAYNWVQQSILHFIDEQPASTFSAEEKRFLKSRLKRVELQLPPPANRYADEPDLFTKNDVYYERTASGDLRMRVGGAYLFTAKSWFNLIFTMAHETAHSIDPCEIKSVRPQLAAYERVTSCFLHSGLVAKRRDRAECGENDQMSETFADWMAVQVTADALKGFATEFHGVQVANAATNAVRDLCEQDEGSGELDLEFHPSPEIRIEKIFGNHPGIRNILGCERAPASTATESYCGFDYSEPLVPPSSVPLPSTDLPKALPIDWMRK